MLLARHFRVAMALVEDVEEPPILLKDAFWEQTDAALLVTCSHVTFPSFTACLQDNSGRQWMAKADAEL